MSGSRPRLARVTVLCALLLFTIAMSSCISAGARNSPTTGERDRIRISGSGTCLPLLRILAEDYRESKMEFVFLPGLHSGGGIQGIAGGDLEIGAISRDLQDEERLLGLKYRLLATDGLAIATHRSVGIERITTEQVRDIYRGKYRNWKQLGGADLAITILDRNEDESAKMILRSYVLGEDLVVTDRAVSLYYESDMVSGLEGTPGAIGYFSLGYAVSQRVDADLLELDGVAPSVENIRNGTYKVLRPLGVVTQRDESPEVERFLDWAASTEARSLIEGEGYARKTQ